MQKTFDFISDPGHGWVKVPKRLLADLLISREISRYSYERDGFAYLEEDCDASKFQKAFLECFGFPPKYRERVARERRSKVRGYDTYSGAQ